MHQHRQREASHQSSRQSWKESELAEMTQSETQHATMTKNVIRKESVSVALALEINQEAQRRDNTAAEEAQVEDMRVTAHGGEETDHQAASTQVNRVVIVVAVVHSVVKVIETDKRDGVGTKHAEQTIQQVGISLD